jgi:hypothetical protein
MVSGFLGTNHDLILIISKLERLSYTGIDDYYGARLFTQDSQTATEIKRSDTTYGHLSIPMELVP